MGFFNSRKPENKKWWNKSVNIDPILWIIWIIVLMSYIF